MGFTNHGAICGCKTLTLLVHNFSATWDEVLKPSGKNVINVLFIDLSNMYSSICAHQPILNKSRLGHDFVVTCFFLREFQSFNIRYLNDNFYY